MSRTQSPRISVNGKILRWAIKRSGKSVDKLVERQQLKGLKDWINGKKDPTVKQLEAFSTATFVPFGYLFFSNPPSEQMPIPYFRTPSDNTIDNTSANMIDAVQIIEQRQDWMREYLISDGAEPLSFVGSVKPTDPHKSVALKIRKELGIDQEWASAYPSWKDTLSDMKNRIEKSGIFLSVNGVVGHNTNRLLDPEEFRGFVLVDEYAPFLFVNNRDFKAAQMFTLAHDLAHVWMGSSAAFDLHYLGPAHDAVESACYQIAAEFLVPMDDLVSMWAEFDREFEPFQAGARHFKVSEIVLARRALDAQLINQEEYRKFYQKEQENASIKRGRGGNFYNNAIVRIGKTSLGNIISAVKEGNLLYTEAYILTGLGRKSFDEIVDRIEGKNI